MKAYSLVEKRDLPEVKGTGYVLSHTKTKARVMVIVNEDNNKVFNIGFRTPPSDNTGVPHIMEHSVLCGSKNFPVKDPFVELCKGSLNTFLNAMTYSDKTVYPVASLNKKDFHNLMHVYLDAVFYPNIYDRTEIMMQEGWHYELDEETEELKINGVVFNEMKGVYSNPEQQLYRIIEASLLPSTAYGYESGGDPVYIPELTQEDFINFHKKFYHPSNSYIYLYGDMDAVAELEFIDREYLSKYDYLDIDSELTTEPGFEEPKKVREYYSLADADKEEDNTYLTYNVSVGNSLDKKLCAAFAVIEHALLVAPGAPLKTALIDAGIGKDIFSSYDDGIKQPNFSIIAKNANEADEDKFIEIIENTLKGLVDNGINKKSLQAAINYFEFKHKEGNFGRFPKGLMLGLNAFNTWLYDDSKALDLFELNQVFDDLKAELDKGYFENLIKTYILENNHKTYAMLLPKKGLNVKREEEEKAKLAAYKTTLTTEEIEDIVAKAKHLEEYQSEPSTPEELESIPLLEIEDIEKKARTLNNSFSEIEMVKVVSHDIFTNGISYINLNFDITDIDCDKYPVVSLLSEIFKYVDTENYSYNELANEINIHTGGIGFTTAVTNCKENGKYVVQFVVNAKQLDDKIDKAMSLVEEILFTSKLSDKKRLREIIAETRSGLKMDLVSSGHITAAGRAMSYVSPMGVVKELLEGVEYYKYLAELDDNFDDKYEQLVEDLNDVLGQVLRRNALTVNYTSDKKPEDMLKESVTSLSKKLSTRLEFENPKRPELLVLNEGFKTSSQVQYVATAGNFRDKGLEYNSALSVLQTIFSYDYLWLNVRVKGGAYGCMCAFARSGNGYFTSYRDPKLMETYDIYKEAAEYVRSFDADDRDMTKYIIGAISKLDAPLTPSAEGNYSYVAYLMGLTDEDLQRDRDEILNANVEKIRKLAPYIEAIAEGDIICAIGGESKLDAAKDNFKEVLSVF
ncbi:MAG: insulinase family protein [Lachnospiraceae bacterium]|nr:insulinase family protein [Lachnospiraceae bacterium]